MLTQTPGVTTTSLQQWHSAIATTIDQDYDDESICHLVDTISHILEGCSCSLITSSPDSEARFIYNKALSSSSKTDQLIQGNYLLNPLYRLTSDHPLAGVYFRSRIVLNPFNDQMPYSVYPRPRDLSDELCIVIPTSDNANIQISIYRLKNASVFTDAQINFCKRIFSTVRAILLKWWKPTKKSKQRYFLSAYLNSAIHNFGNSVLTKREAQITQMTLSGNTPQVIADKLGLQPATIKHHRKNIYKKLDVCSQAELFYLFIDSLKMMTKNSPPDPLINYFKPPPLTPRYSV